MKMRFGLLAGLATVVLAIAGFFLLGSLVQNPEEPASANTTPEPALEPVCHVEVITPDAVPPEASPEIVTVPEPEPEPYEPPQILTVRDISIADNRVWVATPDGLVQTDRNGNHYRLLDTADGFDPAAAVEFIELPNRLLFGDGTGYFEYLGPDVFRQVDLPLTSPVSFCHGFDSLYFIAGYTEGVFEYVPEFPDPLKDDILVTDMVFSPGGLWVGTDGDGLWLYDGESWQRRFLRSDTTAFNYVTTLEYRWPHLMVGTDQGAYRFDGGLWETYTGADSTFPGGFVTDITFANHRWFVGTKEHGLWILLNNTWMAVEDVPADHITAIRTFRADVYIGTQNAGVFVRRNGTWRLLYDLEEMPSMPTELLTLL